MPRPGSERGMVLLVVLLVIALLASLLTEFSFSTLVDLRLAETFRDSTRGYYLARGGVTVARMFIKLDQTPTYDSADELASQALANFPVGGGYVSISGEDLSARLNLNLLVRSGGQYVNPDQKQQFHFLCELIGADDPDLLTDSLLDWLDTNDQEEPKGAEDTYYLSRATPYPAGNGPLASYAELGLVRGFDADMLKRLRPFVAVYSPSNQALAMKVNVNTVSREVLAAIFASAQPTAPNALADAEDAADLVLALRDQGPITQLSQVSSLPNLDTSYGRVISSYLDVSSHFFRITSTADVNDGRRTVTAVITENGDLLEQKVD